MPETKDIIDYTLLSRTGELQNGLAEAKNADETLSARALKFSKGNEMNYLRNVADSSSLDIEHEMELAKRMAKLDKYSDLFGTTSFMEVASQNMEDDVLTRAEIKLQADERGLMDKFSNAFSLTTLSSKEGELITAQKDSQFIEAQIARVPVDKAVSIPELIAVGGGQILGSGYTMVDEMLRNQVIRIGTGVALTLAPSPAAKRVGKELLTNKYLNRTAVAEAIFEGTKNATMGQMIKSISEAHPDMPYDQVRTNANIASNMSSAVESVSGMLGLTFLPFKEAGAKVGAKVVAKIPFANRFVNKVAKMIGAGKIAPEIAEKTGVFANVLKALTFQAKITGKSALITAEELTEEKLQSLIEESVVELEEAIKNPTIAIAELSKGKLLEDIQSAFGGELNKRNAQFVEDMKPMATTIFAMSMLGLNVGGMNLKYSNGQNVDKTKYQQREEDLATSKIENESLVDKVKRFSKLDGASNLKAVSKEANDKLNRTIGENNQVFIDADVFLETSKKMLLDEKLSNEAKNKIHALVKNFDEQIKLSEESGEKLAIPVDQFNGIFETNEEVFNQALNNISQDQESMSKVEIEKAVKTNIERSNADILQKLDENFVYDEVLNVLKEDVKISDVDKQEVAAAIQIKFSTLARASKSGKTSRQIFEQAGLQVELAEERKIAGRTAFEKVFDKIRGVDPTIKDPTKKLASEVAAVKERQKIAVKVKNAKEFRKFLKEQRVGFSKAQVKKMFDDNTTIKDTIKRVGGIAGGLTGEQMANVKDLIRRKKTKKKLKDFYRTEVVQALGEENKGLIKNKGVGLDDLGTALVEDGFFPEGHKPTDNEVIELLGDVNKYTPPVQEKLDALEQEEANFTRDMEKAGITAESTDKQIDDFLHDREVTATKVSDESLIGKRGDFSSANNLIRIAKDGDATTYLHEFTHFFISELERMVSEKDASAEWVDNYEKIREWSGAKEGLSMNNEANRNANEKFVAGIQTYFAEGKAPTAGLRGLFANLRSIFLDVYGSVKASGVPINNDIRVVYDQMFATQEDVKRANLSKGNKVLPKPDDVSKEFYDKYLTDQALGDAGAGSKLLKQTEKDIEAVKQKKIKSHIDGIRRTVEANLADKAIYKLLAFAKENKINIESMGKELSQLIKNPKLKSKEGGYDAVQLAKMYGYANVSDMVEDIATTAPLEEQIAYEVDKQTQEFLATLPDRETPLKAASDRNYFNATIRKALMFGGKDVSEYSVTRNSIIDQTTKAFLNMKIGKVINDKHFASQSRKQNSLAERAYLSDDKETAYKHGKYAAVAQLNSEFSYVARGMISKFGRVIKKIKGTQENIKKIGQDNFDAVASILNGFGLTDIELTTDASTRNLVESFIARMVNDIGYKEVTELSDFVDFLSKGGDKNQMSYKDYAVLSDIINKMIKISRKSVVMTKRGETLEIQNEVNIVTEQFNGRKIVKESAGFANAFSKAYLKVTSIPTFMYEMFGEHFADKYLLPLKEGMVRSTAMNQQLMIQYANINEEHGVEFNNEKHYVEGVGTFTNENFLQAALNIISSSHNRENLFQSWAEEKYAVKGKKLSEAQELSIMKAIPENYYKAADTIIKEIYGENFPALRDAILSRMGVRIKQEIGDPFVTPAGTKYSGGYYPATKKLEKVGAEEDIQQSMNNMFGFDQNGITKDRMEGVITGDLDLTTGTMMRSIYNMSMQVHVLEDYNNVGKILKNKLQLKKSIGDAAYGEIRNWHLNMIKPSTVSRPVVFFDGAFKVAVLGLRATTVAIQTLGLIPSATIIGSRWVLPELASFVVNPMNFIHSMQKASELSGYLEGRLKNPMVEIMGQLETSSRVEGKVSKANAQLNGVLTFGIAYMDAIVSTITWKAEYNKRISLGFDKQSASNRANEMVRQTQGDFSKYAKPELMQGWLNLLSPFMTYFVAMGTKIFSQASAGKKADAMGLAFAVVILSPIIEAMFREGLPEEDEDKDKYFERVTNKMKSSIISTGATMVMPLAGLGNGAGGAIIEGKQYATEIPIVKATKAQINAIGTVGRYTGLIDTDKKVTTEQVTGDILEAINFATGKPTMIGVQALKDFMKE